MQGDKREVIVVSQGKFILIWTKVMAVGCREKGDQEIFRKYNQMYLEIAWIQKGVKGKGVTYKCYS